MRQFIPLVKLDGYWLIADLTGIPDLFSQMQPFARSIARRSPGVASPLLKLRPWAAVTLAVYILAAIPALAYFGFLMVKNLPSFLEKACTALWRQLTALGVVVRDGDMFTTALLLLTVTLLAASVVGMLYILSISIGRPIRIAWLWSRPRPIWRIAVALAILLFAGVIGLLWRPDVERIYAQLTAPTPAGTAQKLLRAASAATGSAISLRAQMEGEFNSDPFTGSVALKRPNLARVEVHSPAELGDFSVISNGQNVSTVFPSSNAYTQAVPGPRGANIHVYVADQVEYFYRPETLTGMLKTGTVSYAGPLTTGGITYDVVEHVSGRNPKRTTRLLIARNDGLVHAVHVTTERPNGKSAVSWAKLNNVEVGREIEPAAFAWQAPAGAGQLAIPAGVTLPGALVPHVK